MRFERDRSRPPCAGGFLRQFVLKRLAARETEVPSASEGMTGLDGVL